MVPAPTYHVVFTGQLRTGFKPQQVQQAFATQLKLPAARIKQLFSGKPQVIKSTASQEEAKKLVVMLAKIGATAQIKVAGAAASNGKAAATTKVSAAATSKGAGAPTPDAVKVAPPSSALHEYAPYNSDTTLKSAATMALSGELIFLGSYLLLLLFFSVGLLYATFFTTWGITIIGFGPLALLLQLLTLPLGLILLLFIAKPLLSLRQQGQQGMVVTPEQEARLHTFVQSICDRMQVPVPQQIQIHSGNTVSLRYQGGLLGLLLNRMVLDIGAPLIGASRTAQLGAYTAQALRLAHGKRVSPRIAYLLLHNDNWLQRALHEDDSVDRLLSRLVDERPPLAVVIAPVQRIVAHSRRILQWRLRLSRRINRRLFHTLVADADQAALDYCGSDGFAALLQQQSLLELSWQQTEPTLLERWHNEGSLPDNLIQLLLARSAKYPATMPQQLRSKQEEEKIASLDPIPADSQRIARAIELKVTPSSQGSAPASALLRNFNKLARLLTARLYHTHLAITVNASQLVPTATTATQRQQQQHLDAVFHKLHQAFTPLQLQQRIAAVGGYEKAIAQRTTALQTTGGSHSKVEQALRNYSDTAQALYDIATEEEIYRSGLWRQWGLPALSRGGLGPLKEASQEQLQAREEELTKLAQQLAPYVQRLAATLSLLATPQGGKVASAAGLQQEVKKLAAVLAGIEQAAPQLRLLQLQTGLLQTLLSFDSGNSSRKHRGRMRKLAGTIRQQVSELATALKSIPYPFGDKPQDLGSFALRAAYEDAGPVGEYDRGNDLVEQVAQVEKQALARLCAIALHVEKALKL